MDGRKRENIEIGLEVEVVLKKDQASGALTHGFVKRILTNSKFHPHGIKVMLDDGKVGRVKEIIE
ncbi:MAG: YwbE family protein [Fluviicola sp. XM-24bin1]|nr:YwbE family protein [bacterium]PWL23439.1 MAG: YwbE family protein [Fluviicola sp. XM-24bin1]